MTQLLSGQPLAAQMRRALLDDIAHWQALGHQPSVAAILVEGDAASACYARAKQRAAAKLGISFELVRLPADTSEQTLIRTIEDFNRDADVHAIMLELPLPGHMSTERVVESIAPEKDVDGLVAANRMANLTGARGLYPATPTACIRLVKHYGHTLSGKHAALIGFGKTVGMPLFHQLIRENATVTVCHAGTPDLRPHLAAADFAFVAVGKAGLITPDMVHPNLVIVDAGINETADHGVIGDVSPHVMGHVAALSPTPGGVGPVTTMQLFSNVMEAMNLQVNPSRAAQPVLTTVM
ncbi:bifunctional 5,10-methylenetetrahydrofolate dehydrogenase/5,10-methenyltetrahydrofolate cyclohydrolase [Alicyclobacillus cycloheptanicus]|uniref:Bifunctional protein FolD n=1 Tax=Alicyclobacillus cycloheptanicus TaxID=1457 RepID=A0ABT9XK48_9BACL|nr:bifunctional 5,10-methylenetetrahydrofolate dehydrogenase/5,10-methenyltetrahydrofolate cyclohydrolase [Alicyclobacillus cycloheptanicus]MDQ0190687.1 methylenetetrahydrofolate dehydrogenase (NADP+)/methenyltetrahydrofolate cyclohydrolase [Alicyclobacillus cycloheptanicus]WDM00298.1 bifunctional 5,10-methylenetetrahydrofolate dehydrogenase/5,10-methenyltetrahydrofolate cyclohydrolase [Alicyclobacillus cycloheptanicus]